MGNAMKPNRKFAHLYAVVRYATDADELTPLELRFQIVKVVPDRRYAEQEATRLRTLNEAKGYHYFVQIARFEEVQVEAHSMSPGPLPPLEVGQVEKLD